MESKTSSPAAGWCGQYFLLPSLAACGGPGNSPSVDVATDPPPSVEEPEEPPQRQIARDSTYHKNTRDIIDRKCVTCHVEANIFDTRVTVPFDAPAGSAVEYHLHNHGCTTWTLLKLEPER